MSRPNVLFVVWDACRYDSVVEHASELNSLALSNVWFERAIAPSPWSLPSHASMFTGEHPYDHGSQRMGDSVDTPLVEELSAKGYSCYGISANGFASQRTEFHSHFDEFRYTGGRDIFADGMDVSGAAQELLREESTSQLDALRRIVKRIPFDDHPVKSVANLLSVTAGEVATKVEPLQRIPNPTFAPTSDYRYTPETNTEVLRSMLGAHDDEPFFVFMNYMDTHRPYKPSDAKQEKYLGDVLNYDDLVEFNEGPAHPWEFERMKEAGTLSEADLETVRGLYAGEVETVDEHLGQIQQLLEREGYLEETLIVVTSDHGENLGKNDERGHRRMGHEASVSEALLRVPLLVAHPDLEERRIERPVSLTALYRLFTSGMEDFLASNGDALSALESDDGIVVSHYPAAGGEETLEKYPTVPESTLRKRISTHFAVAYSGDWKVVADSDGDRWASDRSTVREFDAAPEPLRERCESELRKLETAASDENLSKSEISQLEALGYM